MAKIFASGEMGQKASAFATFVACGETPLFEVTLFEYRGLANNVFFGFIKRDQGSKGVMADETNKRRRKCM